MWAMEDSQPCEECGGYGPYCNDTPPRGIVLRREVLTPWEDDECLQVAIWVTKPWYRRLVEWALGMRPW